MDVFSVLSGIDLDQMTKGAKGGAKGDAKDQEE